MQLIIVGLVVLTFFKPQFGSWAFIFFIGFFELWIILVNLRKIKVNNENNKYTYKEVEVIERYRVFFRAPFVCRIFSRMFSGAHLAVFPLVPWLLFQGLYIQALLIGLNYFVATQLSVICNPQFFLHDNIDKGKIKDLDLLYRYTEDMEAIDSALDKMYSNKKINQKTS